MSKFPDLEIAYQKDQAPVSRGFSFVRRIVRWAARLLGVCACSSLLVASSFISYDYLKTRQAFPQNTFIGELNVSGLNKQEALAKLKSFPLSQIYSALITLESDRQNFSFTPEQLGISLLYEDTVDNAFRATHQENYFAELQERIAQGLYTAPLSLSVDDYQLKALLNEVAEQVFSLPKDARVEYFEATGGYHIYPDEVGRELEIDKSKTTFKQALANAQTIIPLVIKYANPRIKAAELRAHPPVHRLSAYTTYYGTHDSPNRIHNVKLVASWIDGTLLLPGDTFSVASIIGDVTPEKGFKEAFVIVGGELVPLLGGGSCQIATTLYNAVMLANLKVLQRRNHSFYFNIYPLGRDAGVYPGQLDFRFENDSGYPVLIKAVATDERLSFRFYGTPTGKTVTFSEPLIFGRNKAGQFVPMTLKQVLDYDVPFRTSLTRTVFNGDGQKISEEVIGSYYKLYGDKTNVPIRRSEPR